MFMFLFMFMFMFLFMLFLFLFLFLLGQGETIGALHRDLAAPVPLLRAPQSRGGEDDEARMIIATGHIACRRFDAAKEALRGMEQPDGYDEPELLALTMEWLDPWTGRVDKDDLYDWENNSTIDHLREMQKRLKSWTPDSGLGQAHQCSGASGHSRANRPG